MKDKIFKVIEQTSYLTAGEIAERLGEDEYTVERQLSYLLTSGKVKQFNRQYRMCYEGKPAKPRNNPMRGVYDGAELRPYVGRPGAMDAFNLPSMTGAGLVGRVPPSGIRAKKCPA